MAAGLMQFKFMRRAAAEKERKKQLTEKKMQLESSRFSISSPSSRGNDTVQSPSDQSIFDRPEIIGPVQNKIFIIEKTDIACDDLEACGRFSFSGFNNNVLELNPPTDFSLSDPFDRHWEGTNYSTKDEVDRIIDQFTASVDSMKQIRKRYREAEELAEGDPHYNTKITPPRSRRRRRKN